MWCANKWILKLTIWLKLNNISNQKAKKYNFYLSVYISTICKKKKKLKHLHFDTWNACTAIPPLDGSHSETIGDGWFEETQHWQTPNLK